MEKILLCWQCPRMGQKQSPCPRQLTIQSTKQHWKPCDVKSKRLSSITAKYSLQEGAEEKWWCINSCLINNYALPCIGVCCDRRESFAWIFSKGMVEPGFGGWSEIEVNLKGQGRDPRLVTEWPTRYLEVKELICVRYSIKNKQKKRRQWRHGGSGQNGKLRKCCCNDDMIWYLFWITDSETRMYLSKWKRRCWINLDTRYLAKIRH